MVATYLTPLEPETEDPQRVDVRYAARMPEAKTATLVNGLAEQTARALQRGRYLREEGWRVGEHRVANRMREMGLRCKVRRAYRTTTNSCHAHPVAPNPLQRQFTATGPDQVYVNDITYICTRHGWLDLTVVLDLYSRLVVGWALSDSLSHQAVLKALRRAIARRRPSRGLS